MMERAPNKGSLAVQWYPATLCVLAVLKRWVWLQGVARQPRVLLAFAVSALLLSVNWSVYVWAGQNAHMVDASLGYFILPLVNVALGVCLFE